ncbi:MAG: hypothetical protein HC804_13330 [Anaerolineae bacterium]|nr:hypothetical protein [Anaerolineae bacterium]
MTNIDTQTSWKDSGYDCDHCGGQVWQRMDQETGRPTQTCLQCEECGCQWSLKGVVQRVGNRDVCRQAQREREAVGENHYPIPPALMLGTGALVLLLLVLVGGLTAVRFLIPMAIAIFVGWAVVRYVLDRSA